MQELFNIESGINQEFSYAGGRRNECKARGLKPFTKAFRDCTKEMRKADKGLSRSQKKANRKSRRADLGDAIVDGKVKKGLVGKIFGGIKKVAFSVARGPFLVLLKLNAWGISTKLAKLQQLSTSNKQANDSWYKALAHWIKSGGDKNTFIKNINIGKKKKPLLVRTNKLKQRGLAFDGDFMNEFSNVAGVDDAAEAAAVSTPIWIPIVKLLTQVEPLVGQLKMNKQDQQQAVDDAEDPAYALTQQQIAQAKENLDQPKIQDDKILGMPKLIVYVGGGLLAIGAIILALKMKKK